MKTKSILLLLIPLFLYVHCFAQGPTNFLQDKSRRSSIYLFKKNVSEKSVKQLENQEKENNPEAANTKPVNTKLDIASPDANVTFSLYTKVNEDKGEFYDFESSMYSTKGLLNFAVDKDYVFAYEIKAVLGHRVLTEDDSKLPTLLKLPLIGRIQMKVWWAYLKVSFKHEKFEYINKSNFSTANIYNKTVISKPILDACDISANYNFLMGNYTFGASVGVTKNNNYEDMKPMDYNTYSLTARDSLNNVINTLGTSKKEKVGQLKETPYGAYAFIDLFIQTFTTSPIKFIPDVYVYCHGFNLANENFSSYLGIAFLINIDKAHIRHLSNFGIRFQSNTVRNPHQLALNQTNVEILGGVSF